MLRSKHDSNEARGPIVGVTGWHNASRGQEVEKEMFWIVI